MEPGKIIAENMSALRRERGMSLGDLSRACGISKAVLSEMERGAGNPTVNTIWKIANGLQVPYTRLLEQGEREPAVVRREDVGEQRDGDDYRIRCYFPRTAERNFEFFTRSLKREQRMPRWGIPGGRRNMCTCCAARSPCARAAENGRFARGMRSGSPKRPFLTSMSTGTAGARNLSSSIIIRTEERKSCAGARLFWCPAGRGDM